MRTSVPPVEFNNFGFPPDFDYLRVEMWTAVASRNNNAPVYYEPGDYVMHRGQLYRNIGGYHTGLAPDTHPEVWQLQPLPPDDVRLAPASPYQGIGLLDHAPAFQQDFQRSTVVEDYVHRTNPTAGQFNDMSAEVNGGRWSIVQGRLQLVRTGSTAADNDAGITRWTDFPGVPTLLHLTFDLSVSNWTSSPYQSGAMVVNIGRIGGWRDYGDGEITADTFQTFTVKGEGLRKFVLQMAGATSPLLAADGTVHRVALFLNKSGAAATYRAPDGTVRSVRSNGAALWVNNTPVVADAAATNGATSALTDLRIRWSTGDNGTWTLDNMEIRRAFPQ